MYAKTKNKDPKEKIETIEMKIWLNQFVQFVLNSAIEDVSTWIEKQAVICGDKKQPVK